MAEKTWELSGQYMESCNCDYLCPCIYTNPQGPATFDHCTAVMVFRIDEGQFGDVKLDGLKFALVIRSGPVMADGNWVFAGVVDDSADDRQRPTGREGTADVADQATRLPSEGRLGPSATNCSSAESITSISACSRPCPRSSSTKLTPAKGTNPVALVVSVRSGAGCPPR